MIFFFYLGMIKLTPHPFVTMEATTMKLRGCIFFPALTRFLSDLNFNVDDLLWALGWRKVSH